MPDARLERLEYTLRTLIVWITQSANSPLSVKNAENLLAMLAEPKTPPAKRRAMLDPFDVALSELAEQHGQAFFCDPLENEPPCEACAALFDQLRQAARAPLLEALDALETDERSLAEQGTSGDDYMRLLTKLSGLARQYRKP